MLQSPAKTFVIYSKIFCRIASNAGTVIRKNGYEIEQELNNVASEPKTVVDHLLTFQTKFDCKNVTSNELMCPSRQRGREGSSVVFTAIQTA